MANLSYNNKINDWIEKNRDEIIREWIEISKIPAVKGEAEEGAPFGKACFEALSACSDMFQKYGFESALYSGNSYALAKMGKGEKTIGIFSHSDVVPVNEEDWIYTKPFEPKVIDGMLIGRGVEDNKSGIMAALCAMRIIRECGIPFNSCVQTFIGSEEESGMSDIDAFVKEQPMPEVSLVPDANFPCSIGEKGIFQFWSQCDTELKDIISFEGGEAFNIVLDKAVVKIRCSEAVKNEISEKINNRKELFMDEENDVIILTAKGIAKHASEPEGSVNAAYLAAELLSEAESLSENDRKIMEQVKTILSCPFGTSMGIDHDDIRFGKLTFVNGMVAVKERKMKLSFDTRYGSTLNSEALEDNVQKSFGKLGWSVEKISHMPGFSIDDNSPYTEVLEEIYEEITGIGQKAIRLGGGTYARKLRNAFSVGTFNEHREPQDSRKDIPKGHGGAHQADEMIDIEAFFDAVRIVTQYIINIDEIMNEK